MMSPISSPHRRCHAERTRSCLGWLAVAGLCSLGPLLRQDHGHWLEGEWARALGQGTTLVAILVLLSALPLVIPGRGWGRCAASWALYILTLAACLWPLDTVLRAAEARGYGIPALSSVATLLLQLLDLPVTSSNGLLHIRAHEGLISFAPTSDKLALRESAALLLAFTLWFWLGTVRRRWKLLLGFAVLLFVLITLRYGFLVGWFASLDKALVPSHPPHYRLFWSPLAIFPFLGVAALAVALRVRRAPGVRWNGVALPRRLMIVAGLAGACLGFGAVFEDPGTTQRGRVLVDDRFGDHWEPAARLLDTQWYGDYSTYSFSSLVEMLSRRFTVRVNAGEAYGDTLLDSTDVLILKTPTRPIPDEERQAIQRFVERGGGLLVIGDHTNLLGMGTHLNRIVAPYGIRFRYDSVSDERGLFSEYRAPLLGAHPIEAGLRHFQFMTSCSVAVRAGARPCLIVGSSIGDPADYANSSHFGLRGADPREAHGVIALAAVAQAKEGRVAAFTDSTVFSSFDLFKRDHERLALNLVNWLNHRRSLAAWLPSLTVLAGLLLIGRTLAARVARAGGTRAGLLLLLASAGGGGGAYLAQFLSSLAYEVPPARVPPPHVTFLWEGGYCAFPPVLGGLGDLPLDATFDTLFTTTQRLGLEPRVAYRYEDALEGSDALAVINPLDDPPQSMLDAVVPWCDEGGKLIIIDSEKHAQTSAAPRWLERFQIDLSSCGAEHPHFHVSGMSALELAAPELSAFERAHGKGKVVFVVGADSLTREGLGHCFRVPGRSTARLYESVFHLLRDTCGLTAGDRRTYGILD
ncbi:MAG: DUF4350 domain-containing protein [Planctomycetota bacterium]